MHLNVDVKKQIKCKALVPNGDKITTNAVYPLENIMVSDDARAIVSSK
jgi:hypothetical protein